MWTSGATLLVASVMVAWLVLWRRRRLEREVLRRRAQGHQFWLYLETFIEEISHRDRRERAYIDFVGRRLRLKRYGVPPLAHINWGRARHRATVDSSWFYLAMFFIPREIRSPWFDHILEDRQRAAAEGRGCAFIAAMTFAQCLSLLIHHIGSIVFDIVTPFKKSRISRSD
jgi:hypothetical protein